MIVCNTETVYGREVTRILGLVQGSTIQAKNVLKDIGASFKWLVGGEIKSYSRMLTDARNEAMKRMVNQAENLGADAVVNVRFSTSTVIGGAAEILCYGTAVTL